MKARCDGCGAKIQTIDPQKPGYIKSEVYLKNPDNFYCERCYNLIHYNRNMAISISNEQFLKNIEIIAKSKALVVYIVDIFDIEGTFIDNISEYFKDNDLIVVANKFDLFLNSVKVTRVKNYLMNFLKTKQVQPKTSLIISSFKDEDINRLINAIDEYQHGRDVYFFGMTNVGKSSLINAIIQKLKINTQKITISNQTSTTLDFIKIPLPNKTYLIDTPGILNTHQITHYLSKENLNILIPKKYLKPKVYQLNINQALFLGGFCILKFTDGDRFSAVVNIPNGVVIHRTKLENADKFYEEHKDDLLKIPTPEERENMGKLITHEFTVTEEEKVDITVSGLGFVTIIGNVKVSVVAFEKIKIGKRTAIV